MASADYAYVMAGIEAVAIDSYSSCAPIKTSKPADLPTPPPSAPPGSVSAAASEPVVAAPPPRPPTAAERELEELQARERELEEREREAATRRRVEEYRARIAELEDRSEKGKEEEKRLRKMQKKAAKRKALIEELDKKLKGESSIDLAVVMDCTSSMGPLLKKCGEEIINVVTSVNDIYPDITLRVAFVGYRDHCDGDGRLCVLRSGCDTRFTTDISEFSEFVRKLDDRGGGDPPEDVLGGLNVAAELEWASSCRILYHICDAPCHGRKYHDIGWDDHPDGDPNGLQPEAVLKKFAEHKVEYYFGKLKRFTDKMIEEFNKAAPSKYAIKSNSMNVDTLTSVMASSISSSLATSMSTTSHTSTSEDGEGKPEDVKIVEAPPHWPGVAEEVLMRFPMQAINNIEEVLSPDFRCIRDMPETEPIRMKVAPHAFATGAMKAAHYAENVSNPSDKVVLKRTFKESHQTSERCEQFLTCHVAAYYLGEEFNRVKPVGCPSVRYVRASIMQIMSRPKRPYFIEEEAILGDFEKFNNNAGMCRPFPTEKGTDHKAVQAFSHWTYEFSGRRLMVVDCQGYFDASKCQFVLTDPAVHCESLVAFGSTNLQKKGFERFFKTHRCNEICRAMGLENRHV